METIRKFTVLAGFVALIMIGAGYTQAGPPFPVPQGPPVFCWGVNSLDQCVLFLGTEQTCMNVEECLLSSQTCEEPQALCTYMDSGGFCVAEIMASNGHTVDGTNCAAMPRCSARLGTLPSAPRAVCEEAPRTCDLAGACNDGLVCATESGERGRCQTFRGGPCTCVVD
jgi:hypothetical protein